MLESAGNQVPSEDFSTAAFYLIKEVGLSHNEIFGGTETVTYTEEVERKGVLSDVIGYLFGPKRVQRTERVRKRGMDIRAFSTYIELFKEYQEKREQEQKKSKLRNSMKGNTLG